MWHDEEFVYSLCLCQTCGETVLQGQLIHKMFLLKRISISEMFINQILPNKNFNYYLHD